MTEEIVPLGEFDVARLDACLRKVLPALTGPMQLARVSGGQSNPTFFVTYANRRMVLRKQPPGVLLPSAHAVDREFRIMEALRESDVPVPRVLAFIGDRSVIGTPFYVMDRVDGRVFSDPSLPGVAPAERTQMFMAMADTLSRLHRVDWNAIGLSGFGNPLDYFGRQLRRWTRQWELSKTRHLPDIDRLIRWLPLHIPNAACTTISHGDYRIGNLIFHPIEPKVVAVLDWELSTLGHPLADLAFSALAWRLQANQYMGMKDLPLGELGIPAESDYLSRYYANFPGAGQVQSFHYAFALFRLAVIFEGIAARAQGGAAVSDGAAENGKLSADFARIAVEIANCG